MLVNCVLPPVRGTLERIEHGQRTRFAHEAVVGVPVGAVNEACSIAAFVAIFAGYDVQLATIGMLGELGARNW
jgi:hypothetical protein